jgi:segregation and condensation protein A
VNWRGNSSPGALLPSISARDIADPEVSPGEFRVQLDNFDGPFDLLLSLITKRQLDITDVSLGAVTNEFIQHLAALEKHAGLEAASEFLVVAATLLDMKVVGLLPQGDFVDPEDVKVLEARDLLFARLLQYRAFKDIAAWFSEHLDAESVRHPRNVPLEAHYRDHTPKLRWSTTPEDLQALALFAFAPRTIPDVSLDHLHAPLVSVREQAAHVLAAIRQGPITFRALISGVVEKGVIVARFLAVLELYRQGALSFQQVEPLGDVTLSLAREDFSDDNLAALGAEWSDEEGEKP